MRSPTLALFMVLCSIAHGLHFYASPGQTRCFYEELAKNTLVISKFEACVSTTGRDGKFEKVPGLGLSLVVDETFDNDHTVVNQKSLSLGDFAFSALESGEHRFCITPTYENKKATVRVLFDIVQAGDEIIDSQKKDTISMVTNKIKEMKNKLQEIRREQELVREREASFRDASEVTNAKVVKYTLVQLFVLILVCLWQLHYLKNFFIKQKVV